MPTCPAITAPFPTVHEPEMPVSATRITSSPISQLCATWTRLSIFVPRPILVSLQRAAVDGGIGADLHVVFNHQGSLLRKLRIGAGLGIAHVTESVRTQHCTGVDHHAIPQRSSRIDDHARIDAAMLADADSLANHRPGIDACPGANAGVLRRSPRKGRCSHQPQAQPARRSPPWNARPLAGNAARAF